MATQRNTSWGTCSPQATGRYKRSSISWSKKSSHSTKARSTCLKNWIKTCLKLKRARQRPIRMTKFRNLQHRCIRWYRSALASELICQRKYRWCYLLSDSAAQTPLSLRRWPTKLRKETKSPAPKVRATQSSMTVISRRKKKTNWMTLCKLRAQKRKDRKLRKMRGRMMTIRTTKNQASKVA